MTTKDERSQDPSSAPLSPKQRWIDIGVNLTNKRFNNDLEAVLQSAHTAGVEAIIVTGTHLEASHKALEIAQRYKSGTIYPENASEHTDENEEGADQTTQIPALYSTAGVHPHDASSWSSSVYQEIKALAQEQNVVAIGEAGLDFNRNFSTKEEQLTAFEQQLELANELQLPLFLHQRDAHKTFYDLLKNYRDQLGPIVVHCFTDTQKALFDYLDLDCHIGITGWICDERRGEPLQKIVHNIPLNRLMLETDAPYLLPRDLDNPPKDKRNVPELLPHIGHRVAHHCGAGVDELASEVLKTTRLFFGLGPVY